MSPSPVSQSSLADRGDAPERKATLFCQECDHASPVDGDWHVRTVGGSRRVRCPDCRSVVDDRRVAEHPRADDAPALAPVKRYVGALSHYWSAWTTLLDGDSRADC